MLYEIELLSNCAFLLLLIIIILFSHTDGTRALRAVVKGNVKTRLMRCQQWCASVTVVFLTSTEDTETILLNEGGAFFTKRINEMMFACFTIQMSVGMCSCVGVCVCVCPDYSFAVRMCMWWMCIFYMVYDVRIWRI